MTKIELKALIILSLVFIFPFITGGIRYYSRDINLYYVDYGELRNYFVNGQDTYLPGTEVVLYCDYETPSIETNPTFCIDDAHSLTTWDDTRHMYKIQFTMPSANVKVRMREVENWNGVTYMIL